MARILGLWFWITTAAVVALFVSTASDVAFSSLAMLLGWEAGFAIQLAPKLLATIVSGLLIIPFFPFLRRRLWRVPGFKQLLPKAVFEDIDGDWEVTIESNWPTISAMHKASSDSSEPRFDPVARPEDNPALSRHQFLATIELGWDKAKVTFHPNAETPLRQSRTIVFELLKPCQDYPARVFWGFRQFNAEVAATDEDNFLGAAMLDVVSADELVGTYWNNRSWRKGLNVAGRIKMQRLSAVHGVDNSN